MILKLIGADFSENNLGTIGVLNSETKSILSNYSRSLTDKQKYVFQSFLQGLKKNNIWSSIGNLYMPILSGTLSETMYNVKTGKVDAIPNSEEYTLTEHNGLRCSVGSNTLVNNPLCFLYNGSQQSLHCLFYNTSDLLGNQMIIDGYGTDTSGTGGNTNWITCGTGDISTSRFINPTIKTDGNTGVNFGTDFNNRHFSPSPAFQGWTQRTDGNVILGVTGAILNSDSTPISTDNTYSDKPMYPFLRYNKKISDNVSPEFGILSMGGALTNEQLLKYRELVDSFISVLNS